MVIKSVRFLTQQKCSDPIAYSSRLLGNEALVVQHTTLYFHYLILLNKQKEYSRVPNSARPEQQLKKKSK